MQDNMTFLQIQIYTRKFFRTLKRESIISIIIGIIITLLVMAVTYENMYETYEGTKSGLFSLVCVCIWIGIFNSIQLVCREKNDIVKDELDKSLKATAYMAAHFIYQLILCAIQSVIVFLIFFIFIGGEGGFVDGLAYFITIFLIMYASDAMAFVISAAVPNPIVAMTVMPLLLLIQLVMAGVLFELDGASEAVAYCTVSKWGMEALGSIGSICKYTTATEGAVGLAMQRTFTNPKYNPAGVNPPSTLEAFPDRGIPTNDSKAFGGDAGEIALCWLMFILFIAAFYFLSVFALKMTTRRIKK